MKKILIIKIAFISCFYLNIGHASQTPPLQDMPQDVFNETANHMTSKELSEFATVNKAALEKVKNYFEYRKGVLAKMACPVLTKDWILKTKGTVLPLGNPTVVPEQRRGTRQVYVQIVYLNRLNWRAEQFTPIYAANETKLSATIYPTEKIGTIQTEGHLITKTCTYTDPGLAGPLKLMIEDEFLDLPL
jgi:hypothetical protein